MSMKRIGFFQKWNAEAGAPEFSISKAQMVIFTLFSMGYIWKKYVTDGAEITTDGLLLVCLLLAASFAPKLLKDIIDRYFKK